MTPLLEIERSREAVALLRLNRPGQRNALSLDMREQLGAALLTLSGDTDVKVVILTGQGSAFCAGFDLREFQTAAVDADFRTALWASSDRYHAALLNFPLPLICAVNGPALGGGFDTAVLCDLRLASSTATFGHPEASFGDVVYSPLQELIGGAAARDLCLTGRTVDADEARRLGLVSGIFPPDGLAGAAEHLAMIVARSPRDTLLRTKSKIIRRRSIVFETTLAL